MKARRVIISGGGTGGHLYPALVVGKALLERRPGLEIVYVGGRRPAERSLMARQGVRFVPLRIEGLRGRGRRGLRALFLLPGALAKTLVLLLRLRPGLVLGVGGYSSGPVVLLASWLGIPTVILESNVKPGFTNRVLRRWARKAVVAFPESLRYFGAKGVVLGNPVREEFYGLQPRTRGRELALLVFGGSQGSRFLNGGLAEALPLLAPRRDRLRFTHQTGPADLAAVRAAYARHGFAAATVEPYFDDMPARFAASDLVVCRAGATTCAELIAARKAAILVPFAGAAEGHQDANAEVLRRAGGAEVISEGEWTPALFAALVEAFLEDPARITAMEKALEPLRRDRPAERIAGLCLSLLEGTTS